MKAASTSFNRLRTHVFSIALCLAVLAVICSCLFTYHSLNDLPESNRQIVEAEDHVVRLGNLKSVLGTAMSRLRALSWGGDEQDRSDLSDALAIGNQIIDDLSSLQQAEPISQRLSSCRQHMNEIRGLIPVGAAIDPQKRLQLRNQSRALIAELSANIDADLDEIARLRASADQHRREAIWILIGGHVLMLGIVGLLSMARRTEKRLRLDADLRTLEADERFALVIRGSADGIVLTDEVGRVQMVNPAMCEMFHTDEALLLGRPVGSLFATTAIEEWLTNRIGENDAGLSRTVLAKRLDASEFVAELTIAPQIIHQQKFLAISVRDVSEREDSRMRLKQHEAMLDEIPEPLHILDAGGRIVYWNRGAQAMFGYDSDEAIGQTAGDLLRIIPPVSDEGNIHSTGYAEAERWSGKLTATKKDGQSVRIERRRTRIRENDDTIGEVIFDLDLGERKRLQRYQRRSQRLESLGTLASGIAHDLNNLLTPILMSSRMLQRPGASIDRDALLETIATGAKRGADLIDQLLTFARGGDAQHQPLQVATLLVEIMGILERTLPKGVKLTSQIDPDLPEILGDATEISQVLMNLAINARDAMKKEGTLSIVASRLLLGTERSYSYVTLQPGDYVTITVDDTGTGIPPGVRDKIFDPFFTTKERGQGTGLGLSTSIGIVRSHHGAVEVESVVGVGTAITVIFPAFVSQTNATANE